MAIDFPDSPSVDQQYTVGDRAWTWNGDYWALTLTSSTFTASDDPPSSASAGDIWFESDTGKSFVYYDSFWVEIAGRAGSTTISSTEGSNVSVSGTDGEIQYASNNTLASSNTFVWDTANTQLTIGGDILANNVTANLSIIGNNITANANTTTNVIKTNTWQTATGNAAISLNDSGVITSNISLSNASVSGDLTVSGNLLAYLQSNEQTASYTLALTDASKVVEMNVGSANNLTVPANSTVAFPVGTQIIVIQKGAGTTTFVAAGGVTINSRNTATDLNAQYSAATLLKVATDTWYLFGDII